VLSYFKNVLIMRDIRKYNGNHYLNQYFKNMARRKLKDKNIRKILRNGGSYAVTIPIEILKELKWKEKQKVVVKKRGKGLSVVDWE